MSTIRNTVDSYKDQIVDLVKKVQAPLSDYVAKGAELAGDRLPDVTLPTPREVLDTQVAFAKKLADGGAAFVSKVRETVAQAAGHATPKKAAEPKKAATPKKAVKSTTRSTSKAA